MYRMKKQASSIALIALAMGTSVANAGLATSLLWDDFDVLPNGHLGGAASFSSVIFNDPFAQGGSFTLDTMFNSGSDAGAVFFNSGIGTEQGASISYNQLGDQAPNSSMDFSALGAESFEIDFLLSDQVFDMEVVMTSASGTAHGVISVPVSMEYTASFILGDLMVSPSFDFSNVSDVTFSFNLRDSAVASLDFVATEIRLVVPNSGSMALFSIGGVMMTRRRR